MSRCTDRGVRGRRAVIDAGRTFPPCLVRRRAARVAPVIRGGAARATLALAALAALTFALVPRARAETVVVAAARPRGFFPLAAFGRARLPASFLNLRNVDFAGEIYLASHDGVTSTALSAYVMLRHDPFPRAVLRPWAAVGVGAHAIRARVTIPDVRSVSTTETSAKGHFWAGVRLPLFAGLAPAVETRWTAPSKYVFDYVALGVSF